MKLKLPNLLTSCNLFSGCIASVMVFRNHLDFAAYFVFAAAIFDLLDGMAARKVLSNPAFGKELDSLADIVSFGFVPAAGLDRFLRNALHEVNNKNHLPQNLPAVSSPAKSNSSFPTPTASFRSSHSRACWRRGSLFSLSDRLVSTHSEAAL